LFAEGGRKLTFTGVELGRELRQALKEEGMGPALATKLRDDLTQNSGILRRTAKPDYFFLHLTIQEYLAAGAIARLVNEKGWETRVNLSGGSVTLRQLVNSKAWDPRWQEVMILLTGQLRNPALLLELLADERQDDYFGHRLSLACQCLPELDLEARASHSDVVDRITTTAFALWWQCVMNDIGEVVQHLDRALPALGQVNACVSGGAITPKQPELPLLDLLSELLCDMDDVGSDTYDMAIYAVGRLGTVAATVPSLAGFAELMNDEAYELGRAIAMYEAGELYVTAATPASFSELVEWLRDADWTMRSSAAEAAGDLGEAAATPPVLAALAELLQDAAGRVRWAASEAIAKLMAGDVRIFEVRPGEFAAKSVEELSQLGNSDDGSVGAASE
jgi:HEAT repeat protein